MSLVIGVDGERCRREGGGDGGACVGWVIGEMFLFLPILARLFLINHACYYDYRNTQKTFNCNGLTAFAVVFAYTSSAFLINPYML